ncbi:MAG: hypothetical protein RJQ09_08500 [Cyclobacteriaceae bacterium]
MKLFDTIIFTLAIGFTIIGFHQAFTVGIAESYWIFMLSLSLLLLYKLRKKNDSKTSSSQKQK